MKIILTVLVLAVTIAFLPLVPATAQTGHPGACLVVDNQTAANINVATRHSVTENYGMVANVIRAHERKLIPDLTERKPTFRADDYTGLISVFQLGYSANKLSWTWSDDFRNDGCPGAWILIVVPPLSSLP